VGERIRRDVSPGAPLQAVVADGARCVECLFDITLLEDPTRPVGVISPDAGQAVGLQFEHNRKTVSLFFTDPAPQAVDLICNPQKILDVVSDLVGNHFGLGNVARGTKRVFKILKKTLVVVDFLVARAVKRPHGGLGKPARRLDRP